MQNELIKWLSTSILPFALGVIWQSWRASSSEMASQINDLLKDLKSLEDTATEFWTTNHDEPKNDMRQARIRGLTFGLARYEEQATDVFGKETARYLELMDQLIEVCTGGEFETNARRADYTRAIEVQSLAAEIAAIARSARRRSAGMGFAGYYTVRLLLKATLTFLNLITDIICAAMRTPIAFRNWWNSRIPPLF